MVLWSFARSRGIICQVDKGRAGIYSIPPQVFSEELLLCVCIAANKAGRAVLY